MRQVCTIKKALTAMPGHVGAQKSLTRLKDSDSQNIPADTNHYDRGGQVRDTMMVGVDTPLDLMVEDSKVFAAGTRFPIGKATMTIGRKSSNDIAVVNDDIASKVHAQVTRHGEHLSVEDMGSTNGTYVNGGRISGVVPVRSGDELRVGSTRFRCVHSDTSADTRERPAASAETQSSAQPKEGQAPRYASEAHSILGRVQGLRLRNEADPDRYSAPWQIWVFQVTDGRDEDGNRLPSVVVQMRGRSFEGIMEEGDEVEVRGRWRAGETMHTQEVYNRTKNVIVRAAASSGRGLTRALNSDRASSVGQIIGLIFALLILMFIAWVLITGFSTF